jgi:adenine specific DNA methylase Mod
MPTLDWIGKKAVVNHHQDVPYRLIHCDGALSDGDPDAGNLLVEGDNLVALKALLPYYAGKVKCIYIDPPYNTGNENWVYNDNVNSPEIVKWLGEAVGKEAEDLSRHDKWLCMMYPRLRLLRDFLREDGAIFISIDDNEVQNLRAILDAVFGKQNFIACIVWQKRTSRENRSAIGDSHEYLLVYAKLGVSEWKEIRNKLPPNDAGFPNPDNDARGPWRSIPFSAQGFRHDQMYTIETPTGEKLKPPAGRCWGATEPVYKKFLLESRVYFPRAGAGRPRIKVFKGEEEGLAPNTLWMAAEVGDNERAKKEIIEIFGDDIFDTPKPEALLFNIITIASNPGEVVLDSFLGSGTTAAVAHKMGRRYIGIEMSDHARRFAAKRLSKVVSGEVVGISESVDWRGGGGFRYCNLGEPLFDADGGISPTVTFPDLAAHVFFAETGQPIPNKAQDGNPFLGTFQNRAVYLLWSREGASKPGAHRSNILSAEALSVLPSPTADFSGERVVYADGCTVSRERLTRDNILFKQVPYRVAGN